MGEKKLAMRPSRVTDYEKTVKPINSIGKKEEEE
jgi:hypothetical protein